MTRPLRSSEETFKQGEEGLALTTHAPAYPVLLCIADVSALHFTLKSDAGEGQSIAPQESDVAGSYSYITEPTIWID